MKQVSETKIMNSKTIANQKAFKKELYDKAWERIEASTIPDLVKLAMLMSNSLSLLTERIDMMIRGEMNVMGITCKPNSDGDIIKGLKNYSEKVKAAMYWFERDLQKFITDSTFDSYGVGAFDKFNHSSADVIQILMLCVDRGETEDGMRKIFNSLHRLKAGSRFSDDDIAKFDFKD